LVRGIGPGGDWSNAVDALAVQPAHAADPDDARVSFLGSGRNLDEVKNHLPNTSLLIKQDGAIDAQNAALSANRVLGDERNSLPAPRRAVGAELFPMG
jgi:hypothetical protein